MRTCRLLVPWRLTSALPVSLAWVTRRQIGSRSEMLAGEIRPNSIAMSASSDLSSRRLERTILRSVSRSFYLSIRFLPAQLREPVALAYLLARTTDSVADTPEISNLVRIETLKMLSDGVQSKASRDVVINLIASFIPLQSNKSEQQLLE